MDTKIEQRLIEWTPVPDKAGMTSSFGDIAIESGEHQSLIVTLPYEEGKLRVQFRDVRAFVTSWDGDPNPFLTFDEASKRPSDLFKVEASRWLSSSHFNLDAESSLQTSYKPWEHFCIVSGERSLHVAARDDVEALWVAD